MTTTADPRLTRHREIEAELTACSDADLTRLLVESELAGRRHGSVTLPDGRGRVFVKLLPLTALEWQLENRHSTANFLELPACYHYRLGSRGFGVWRELEAHGLANEWVLSGRRASFPLLHHWRRLPIATSDDDEEWDATPWGGDAAIQRRVSAIAGAESSVALFMELFPQTLGQWLRDRLLQQSHRVLEVSKIEEALFDILHVVNGEGVLHMDAHLENILTDGRDVFLGDPGLAISRSFRLDADELDFFDRHANFDRCTVVTALVHALVAQHDPRGDWRRGLSELLSETHHGITAMPDSIRSYLSQRGPLALAMGAFYREPRADLSTDYPADRLQTLLDGA